jgi:glycerol-3-phosphate acyltransferase PlsY
MNSFFWPIISYFLGSIPSGYIITKLSSKKNVLEIGWKKTSGSNVWKNVGKWQGALTGILDILKGYLAVFFAQKLGFSSLTKVFSGVAVLTGNNWSIFLNFAGGRGIGTFMGALLALYPKILGFSVSPFIALSLIWNASIGTILFLITILFLAARFNQFETGLFTLISLLPIFIKRLSPIGEIKTSQNKIGLIRNRLIFDNDQLCLDFRIKRIIKKLTPH